MARLNNSANTRSIAWAILAFAFLFLFGIAPAAAQEPVTDDDVNEVAKEVYCPVCESTPLDVCETKACADWRELIRTKLGEGQTKQQIYDYFANQYGDRVLASPPREGIGLLLWIWPIVAVVAGVFFFARYLRSLRGAAVVQPVKTVAAKPGSETESDAADDYVARIESELARK
jgi:cytochrome c-type biogenesis protein CcmH